MSKRPAWYGGNKIPDSYLKKFMKSVEDEGIPYELRVFLDRLDTRPVERHTDQHE